MLSSRSRCPAVLPRSDLQRASCIAVQCRVNGRTASGLDCPGCLCCITAALLLVSGDLQLERAQQQSCRQAGVRSRRSDPPPLTFPQLHSPPFTPYLTLNPADPPLTSTPRLFSPSHRECGGAPIRECVLRRSSWPWLGFPTEKRQGAVRVVLWESV